jgi:hypothetical protein
LPINIGSQKRSPKTFLSSSKLQLFEIKEILFFQKIGGYWYPICTKKIKKS